jgi:hypothetical protein
MKKLSKYYLTLLILLGIVFGNQNLLSQNNESNNLPLIDPSAIVIAPPLEKDTLIELKKDTLVEITPVDSLIPDSVDVGKILRIIYKSTPGVFLTNEQELITLAKFQWKEIYKLQAQEFKFENYKLRVDINDAYKERDRYKKEAEDSQNAQLKMSRSYENSKSMLEQKTKENAINESLKNQYKKESIFYKITTGAAILLAGYLLIK